MTNEKRLLERAGLRAVDGVVAGLRPEPDVLDRAVSDAEALFSAARS